MLYCPRPFNELHYAMHDAMGPCCVNNYSEIRPISEYFASEKMQIIRTQLEAGIAPPECQHCVSRESTGANSHRTQADRTIQSTQLRNVEVRFSNICNFKCRTCVAATSSAIAAEDRKFHVTELPAIRYSGPTDSFVLDEIKSVAQSLSLITFSGGEPLVQWQHWAMLDHLIEHKLDPKLLYYSNGSTLSFKGKSIVDKWNHFSSIHFKVSIDAVGKQADYWRHGTKWDELLENLKTIQQKAPHVFISVTITLSWVNILALREIVSTLLTFDPAIRFGLNPVSCGEFSLQVLPASNKLIVTEYLKGIIGKMPVSPGGLNSTIAFMNGADRSELMPAAIYTLHQIDQRRNESFVVAFPEHAELFNLYRPS